jgi:hypothetical protein
MSMKVAMFETIAAELLVDRFLETADPVGSALAYAEQRRQLRPNHPFVDPEADLAVEAVWSQFLDRVVDAVRRAVAPP